MGKCIKLLFLSCIMCCLNSCFVEAQVDVNFRDEMLKLDQESEKLDKLIIKEMRFKLSKDQSIRGNTEKYMLESNIGDEWLFKTYRISSTAKDSRAFYKLAGLFGIITPTMYVMELPINKNLVYGSIQKLLPENRFKQFDEVFLDKISSKQIIAFQKQYVLDWLVSNGEVESEEFFVDINTGNIIPIDRDEIFCGEKYYTGKCLANDADMAWYTKFFGNIYKKQKRIDVGDVFEMIDYIQSLDDEIIGTIFKNVYGIEGEFYLKQILEKKHNLRKDFEVFYLYLADKIGKNIQITGKTDPGNYTKMILKRVQKDISDKQNELVKLKKRNNGIQENIEVFSSKEAWYLLYYKLKYAPKGRFFSNLLEIIDELEVLKREPKSIYEKYAINLYITQLKEIKKEYERSNIERKDLIQRIALNPSFMSLSHINDNFSFFPENDRTNNFDKEKSVMNEIINRFRESQKLDEKIVERMRFELLEDQTINEGATIKYLLKSNNLDLWLFKSNCWPKQVKASRSAYFLAELMGISTPLLYEITLPINGEKVYGSIQKFISGAIQLEDVEVSKLKNNQIRMIQNCQVFDWLIFNSDSGTKHFIIEPKTKEIITIDKDNSLSKIKETFLDEYLLSEFDEFWTAYIKGEININFKNTFNFIDYIQNIDDDEFLKILSLTLGPGKLMDNFFLRKAKLRNDFEKFYYKLLILRGEPCQTSYSEEEKEYPKIALGKIKNSVLRKKRILEDLKNNTHGKQKGILVVSSKKAWSLARRLSYSINKEFLFNLKKTVKALKNMENSSLNIYEKLAVSLYLEEVKRESKESNIENFIKRTGIKQITIHPSQMTEEKISNIEYNLRSICGEKRKSFSKYKKNLAKDEMNILLHLNYIKYPIRKGIAKGEKGYNLLEEYKQKMEKEKNNLVYKFIYGILLGDLGFLKKIDDNFSWKYLGMALAYSVDGYREKAIQYCNKTLVLNKNNSVAYWSHMLMGLLYEYNEQWDRFGRGFEIVKAIEAYKKALEINTNSINGHVNLGILYLIKEMTDEALNEFRAVDKIDPRYGKKHFHLNRIKEKSTYKDNKDYLEAVRMNTLSGRQHYILGLADLVKNDTKLAKKHFNKAEEFGYKFNLKWR